MHGIPFTICDTRYVRALTLRLGVAALSSGAETPPSRALIRLPNRKHRSDQSAV